MRPGARFVSCGVSSEGRDEVSTSKEVTVEVATAPDAEALLELRDQLSAWLAARGIVQWRKGSLSMSRLCAQIEAGEVFVARCDGQLAGSLTLSDEDVRIWGEEPTNAGYLHRLMVDRRWAHRHLGVDLLAWGEHHCRAKGKTHLRLDCVEINDTLIDYYTRAGYRDVRRVRIDGLPHRGGLVLFEKPLIVGASDDDPTTRL